MTFPFVVDQGATYDTVGNKQLWVSQPSSGLDKRQATLQHCIRAEGDQGPVVRSLVSAKPLVKGY